MKNPDGQDATTPSLLITPELLQQLRDSTSDTPIGLERLAVQVRNMILAAPSGDGTRQDANGNFVAVLAQPRPNLDPKQSHNTLNLKGEPIALPKFIECDDKQSPREFLECYQEYCDVCSIPVESRVQLLPAALDGAAKQWWRFVGGCSEWSTFATEFEAEFAGVDYKAELDQRT